MSFLVLYGFLQLHLQSALVGQLGCQEAPAQRRQRSNEQVVGYPETAQSPFPYLFSLPVSRKVMVPQKSRARICTGRWRSSSVYQIQMLPRFFTTPASAVGCTRRVLKVPSGGLDLFAALHLHGHRRRCAWRRPPGCTKLLPTSMGCDEA